MYLSSMAGVKTKIFFKYSYDVDESMWRVDEINSLLL